MLGEVSPLLAAIPGVSHRFFGRVGGTSPHPWRSLNTSYDVDDAPARVDENLARVRFQIGVPRASLYACTQVHGAAVVCVGGDEDPAEVLTRKADALLTSARDVAVGVRTADCAPVLLAGDDGSAVAAVHVGWRGAVGGVLAAAVTALCQQASVPPARLVGSVGPCIGQDAFEVGPEVVTAARAAHPGIDALVRAGAGDRGHLDLGGLSLALLAQAGVTRADRVGDCTASHLDRYFSHRAEHGHTGRQLAVIARAEPPRLDDEAFR
ncbi:MAG: laccase domain-containing protein [Deltaproteobacteria bacterium]|nr:laccase domain-containing protein [Deltaproteobacteria bacterium]